MLQAMFNGVSAIEAQQQSMDVIGNNIANVNTTGYKASRVTFQDQLSETIAGASAGTKGSSGGTNAIQLGLEVKVASIDTLTQQGGLQSTSKPTDMAIQGNGYFMLGSGGAVTYTRDGSFTIDSQGNLVNASNGSYVLGWAADGSGNINTTPQVDSSSHLSIPVGGLTSTSPTKSVTFGGNLSADATPSSTPYTRSVKVYDSLGESQTVTLNFTPQPNQNIAPAPSTAPALATDTTAGTLAQNTPYFVAYSWTNANGETVVSPPQSITTGNAGATNEITTTIPALPAGVTAANVYVGTSATNMKLSGSSSTGSYTISSVPAGSAASPPTAWAAGTSGIYNWTASGGGATGSGTVTYDSSGNESGSTGAISLALTDGATTPQVIKPDFTSTTQVSGSSTAAPTGQDGFGPGTLESFSVDPTGVITGIFNNGFTRTLGQIAMADFSNPGGLQRDGANEFSNTVNSGIAQVGTAGSGSLGNISTGYLEQSNVDLSNEFTNMIVTQRGFQANTKIVTTVDQMLNDVISMKQ